MYSMLKLFLAVFVVAYCGWGHADVQRGVRNYQAILAGQKKIEQLSPQEIQEVLAIHSANESQARGNGCVNGANGVACSGSSSECVNSPYGVACGGNAAECVNSPYGVACGGKATYCVNSPYGVACGGMATECVNSPYGVACGGRADQCVNSSYGVACSQGAGVAGISVPKKK